MVNLDMRWMNDKRWLKCDTNGVSLKDDAPADVKESYKAYLLQKKKLKEREQKEKANVL